MRPIAGDQWCRRWRGSFRRWRCRRCVALVQEEPGEVPDARAGRSGSADRRARADECRGRRGQCSFEHVLGLLWGRDECIALHRSLFSSGEISSRSSVRSTAPDRSRSQFSLLRSAPAAAPIRRYDAVSSECGPRPSGGHRNGAGSMRPWYTRSFQLGLSGKTSKCRCGPSAAPVAPE